MVDIVTTWSKILKIKINKNMKTLNEFAKEKSNFVSVKDGETARGIFRGYKFIEKEVRGETKEYARYLIEDPDDGKTRNLDSQSAGLANQMAEVKEGDLISISRIGEGFDTKWKVEIAGANGKKTSVADEDIPVVEESEEDEVL